MFGTKGIIIMMFEPFLSEIDYGVLVDLFLEFQI